MVYTFHCEAFVAQPVSVVFDFFSRAENLEKLTPPWLSFRIDTPQPISMRQGARIAYRLRLRGIPIRWLTEIETWDPPRQFVDVQRKGPYKLWRHTHRFFEVPGGTKIEDTVNYELPFGWIGRLVNRAQVRRDVARIFEFRSQRIHELLEAPSLGKER